MNGSTSCWVATHSGLLLRYWKVSPTDEERTMGGYANTSRIRLKHSGRANGSAAAAAIEESRMHGSAGRCSSSQGRNFSKWEDSIHASSFTTKIGIYHVATTVLICR